jgi:hypothetical protein
MLVGLLEHSPEERLILINSDKSLPLPPSTGVPAVPCRDSLGHLRQCPRRHGVSDGGEACDRRQAREELEREARQNKNKMCSLRNRLGLKGFVGSSSDGLSGGLALF